MADTTTLGDAVNAAVEELAGKGELEAKPEVKTETKVEKAEDDDKGTETKLEVKEAPPVEVDASPEEVRAGLTLLRSLGDPVKRTELLQHLAESTGFDLSKKADQRKVEKGIKEVLKEKLGADGYELIYGDKVAEALETLFDTHVSKKVNEVTQPVLTKLAENDSRANEAKASDAMETFFVRHKVPDDKREEVAGKMLAKMKRMPAASDTDVSGYLDDIYSLTSKDTKEARTVKDTVGKITRNAKEVRNTSGEGGSPDETRVRSGSKLPSLRESVEAGYRGERFDN